MRKAGRFGQTIFNHTVKHDFYRIFQQTFVADRYENRLDIGACSDYRADDLIFIF